MIQSAWVARQVLGGLSWRTASLLYNSVVNQTRVAVAPWHTRSVHGRFLPGYLTLQLTTKCNLACRMCSHIRSDVKHNQLDLNQALRLIDEVAIFRPWVSLTGGEPFLYPHLFLLLERLHLKGVPTLLVNNGTLLQENIPTLLETPPHILVVSIDGPQELHDSIRGVRGTYQKVLASLHTLKEEKERRGQFYPLIAINACISDANYMALEPIVRTGREVGADWINFNHLWFVTPSIVEAQQSFFPFASTVLDQVDLRKIQIDALSWSIAHLRPRKGVSVYPQLRPEQLQVYYHSPEEFLHSKTLCPWIQARVAPDGGVHLCPGLEVGRLGEESFMEIWSGVQAREVRALFGRVGRVPACARCCWAFINPIYAQ